MCLSGSIMVRFGKPLFEFHRLCYVKIHSIDTIGHETVVCGQSAFMIKLEYL